MDPIVAEEQELLLLVTSLLKEISGPVEPDEAPIVQELEGIRDQLLSRSDNKDTGALTQQWNRQSALLAQLRSARGGARVDPGSRVFRAPATSRGRPRSRSLSRARDLYRGRPTYRRLAERSDFEDLLPLPARRRIRRDARRSNPQRGGSRASNRQHPGSHPGASRVPGGNLHCRFDTKRRMDPQRARKTRARRRRSERSAQPAIPTAIRHSSALQATRAVPTSTCQKLRV